MGLSLGTGPSRWRFKCTGCFPVHVPSFPPWPWHLVSPLPRPPPPPYAQFRQYWPQFLASGQALLMRLLPPLIQVTGHVGEAGLPGTGHFLELCRKKAVFPEISANWQKRPGALSGPSCYYFGNPCVRIQSTQRSRESREGKKSLLMTSLRHLEPMVPEDNTNTGLLKS